MSTIAPDSRVVHEAKGPEVKNFGHKGRESQRAAASIFSLHTPSRKSQAHSR